MTADVADKKLQCRLIGTSEDEEFAAMIAILFSYIGPETMLPVASAFAAILGGILVCWRWIIGFVMKGYRLVFRRPQETEPLKQEEAV